MRNRVIVAVVLVAVGLLGACRREQPAQQPTPVGLDDDAARRAAEEEARRQRARQDSLAAAERARLEAEEASRRAREMLLAMIFFDYDSSEIRGDARGTLDQKVQVLRANPSVTVRIEGHADERGSTEYNIALGMRRAESVRQYLAGFGLPSSRFEVTSLGEEQPLDPGQNESAWARNRRAEFEILTGGDRLTPPSR